MMIDNNGSGNDMFAGRDKGDLPAPVEAVLPGGGDNQPEVSWQKQVMADVETFGADVVLKAMVDTGNAFIDRNYSQQSQSLLHWHKLAGWALPRALALDPDELRLIDGYYYRAWVCYLDGVKIDGHVYTEKDGVGLRCAVCGESKCQD